MFRLSLLTIKIWWIRLKLLRLTCYHGIMDRVFGPVILFKYGPPSHLRTTSVRFWDNEREHFHYVPVRYCWGRKYLGWFNYYRSKPGWWTESYPNLVFEYCHVDKLKELHDRREETFKRLDDKVSRLNNITLNLNARFGKFNA